MFETESQQSVIPYPSPLVPSMGHPGNNSMEMSGNTVYPRLRAQSEESIMDPHASSKYAPGNDSRNWEWNEQAAKVEEGSENLGNTDQQFNMESPGYSFPRTPNRSEF